MVGWDVGGVGVSFAGGLRNCIYAGVLTSGLPASRHNSHRAMQQYVAVFVYYPAHPSGSCDSILTPLLLRILLRPYHSLSIIKNIPAVVVPQPH